jgi:arsenate reductase
LLQEHDVAFTYREYTKDPLSEDEIRTVLAKLGMRPREVLRTRDAKKAGLTGDEADDALISAMAANPRLLQRPIAVLGDKAALGRPFDKVLSVL